MLARVPLMLASVVLLAGIAIASYLAVAEPSAAQPVPTPPAAVGPPAPVGAISPAAQREAEHDRHVRAVINGMSDERRIWTDSDTVVYLLPRDPHVSPPTKWIVVVDHLPSKTAINYDDQGTEIAKSVPHTGSAVEYARLKSDPAVNAAVALLRGRAN